MHTSRHQTVALALLAALLLSAPWTIRAQDDDDAKKKKSDFSRPPGIVFDPAVNAIIESNPQTGSELVKTIKILIGLKHPKYAREFLGKLLALNLDEAQMAALVKEFGSGPFLEMTLTPELQPEGKPLAEKVLAAARKQATDPARITGLIQKLNNPAADIRQTVALDMRSAGTAIVNPLLATLADKGQEQVHPYVRTALVVQGSVVVPPLVGALETDNPDLKAQIIEVLGRIGDEVVAPFLLRSAVAKDSPAPVQAAAAKVLAGMLGKAPNLNEALFLLERSATQYFDLRVPLDTDLDGKVEIWHWENDATMAELLPADTVSTIYAARLARDAYQLDPENEQLRQLYLATLLQSASLRGGLGQPVADAALNEAAGLGIDALVDAVRYSLAHGHSPAATAAIQVLGEKGTADLLNTPAYSDSSRYSVFIQAARHEDRRLRAAAIEAVAKLKPEQMYPGASMILESAGNLVAALGRPRAVVVDGNITLARRMAGMLASLGYDAEATTDRREMLKLAARGDCELVLIGMTMGELQAKLALRSLRNDGRTAALPVGMVASPDHIRDAIAAAEEDKLTGSVIRPPDAEAMQFQIDLLYKQLGRVRIDTAERNKLAQRAVAVLAELSKNPGVMYDLKRVVPQLTLALYVPELSAQAAAALGNIGSAEAQSALVDVASNSILDIAIRKAAAAAFDASVRRKWGTLLTTRQIVQQYERYNASETADAETQQVLGAILDSLEHKLPKAAPKDEAPAPGNAQAAVVK